MHWFNWFKDLTGAWDPSGPTYNFWSGFAPNIAFVSIFGTVIAHWRHINCHERHCFRIARHEYDFDGVKYKVCARHHPGVNHANPPRAKDFADHHAAKTASRAKKGTS